MNTNHFLSKSMYVKRKGGRRRIFKTITPKNELKSVQILGMHESNRFAHIACMKTRRRSIQYQQETDEQNETRSNWTIVSISVDRRRDLVV